MARKRARRSRRQPERPLSQSALFASRSCVPTSQHRQQLPSPSLVPTSQQLDQLPTELSIKGYEDGDDHHNAQKSVENQRRERSTVLDNEEVGSHDAYPTGSHNDIPSLNDLNGTDCELDAPPAGPIYITNPTTVTAEELFDDDSSSDDNDTFVNQDAFDIFNEPSEQVPLSTDSSLLPSPATSSLTSADINTVDKLVKYFISFMRRPVFLGTISLYGKVRYTLEHYDHLVALMKDADSVNVLPCSTTMRQSVFPSLLLSLFVPSSIEWFPSKKGVVTYIQTSNSRSTRRSSSRNGINRQNEAVVVLPSDWAKMDIRTLPILRELICFDQCRCQRSFGKNDLRINTSSHIVKRQDIARHAHTLWVNKGGLPHPSSVGTVVRCHFLDEGNTSPTTGVPADVLTKQATLKGEQCRYFEATLLSTLSVSYSKSRGHSIEHGLEHSLPNNAFRSFYDDCVTHLQSLCRQDEESVEESDNDDDQPHEDESSQRDLPQTRRNKRKRPNNTTDQQSSSNTNYLLPSDHLSVLQVNSNNTIAVFLSRYWVNRLDDERNFILFLSRNQDQSISISSVTNFGAPSFVKDKVGSSSQPDDQNICRTRGTLPNGKTYYVYRLILYADDFTARSPLFPKGSVGGVYMSPSGLHIRSRRSQGCIRTVSLTPPGVSTNSVLQFLIDDLVSGSIVGFDCVDACGNDVRVYFDITGFVADYPASSAAVDVSGHTSLCPCTHCSFVLNRNEAMSTYAFTSSITSANSTYRRTQGRAFTVRESGVTKEDCKHLGLSYSEAENFPDEGKAPLLKLAETFNSMLKDHHDSLEITVMPVDGYDMNIIAPDHLITGLTKGLLTIVFLQLPDEDARVKLQISLKSSLAEHGYQTQTVFFKKNKLVSSISMSILFCLLALLPTTLESLGLLELLPCKHLLFTLNRFYTLAFWWPNIHTDGHDAWNFVHGSKMKVYHKALQKLASNFVKSVNKFHQKYPKLAIYVDKPNTHRLLELCIHTIPRFNHILFICELVYESAHQPLKFYLSRNHTLNSHVYAVQLILAKDWLQRVWALWALYRDESETERYKELALDGLIRLLGGKGFEGIDWTSPSLTAYREELKQHIYYIMRGTVEGRLQKWYNDTLLHHNNEPRWVLYREANMHMPVEVKRYLNHSLQSLSSLCGEPRRSFTICNKVLLHRGFGSTNKGSHERIVNGDIVQLLLKDGYHQKKFFNQYICDEGAPTFFVIGGLCKGPSDKSWAIVKPCKLVDNQTVPQLPDCSKSPVLQASTSDFYSVLDDSFQFIEMTKVVRKIGVIHNCSYSNLCEFDSATRRVKHCTTTTAGGSFLLVTRWMGYPPRKS